MGTDDVFTEEELKELEEAVGFYEPIDEEYADALRELISAETRR